MPPPCKDFADMVLGSNFGKDNMPKECPIGKTGKLGFWKGKIFDCVTQMWPPTQFVATITDDNGEMVTDKTNRFNGNAKRCCDDIVFSVQSNQRACNLDSDRTSKQDLGNGRYGVPTACRCPNYAKYAQDHFGLAANTRCVIFQPGFACGRLNTLGECDILEKTRHDRTCSKKLDTGFDYDDPDSDIDNEPNVESAKKCCQLCTANSECKYFSYMLDKQVCLFKSSNKGRKPNKQRISGPVEFVSAPTKPQRKYLGNYVCPSNSSLSCSGFKVEGCVELAVDIGTQTKSLWGIGSFKVCINYKDGNPPSVGIVGTLAKGDGFWVGGSVSVAAEFALVQRCENQVKFSADIYAFGMHVGWESEPIKFGGTDKC